MNIVDSINRYLAGAETSKGERTRLVRARDEIVRLRAWIAAEGVQTDTCTYYILKTECADCRCGRVPK